MDRPVDGPTSKRPAWSDDPLSASISKLSSSSPRDASPQRETLLVSQRTYRLCWWVVLAVHSFLAVFVLFVGLCHLALSIPVIHSSTIALGISIPLKCLSGVSYVVVASLHFRAVVHMISRSVRARRLSLVDRDAISSKRRSQRTTKKGCVGRAYHRVLAFWSRTVGVESSIGFHGKHFATAHALRECAEVIMQTYQVVSMSQSIAGVWLNWYAVVTVVLNCWSTLIVRLVCSRRSVAVTRLLHLLADMYLDFVFGIILPVCVTLPYAFAYDWANGSYPKSLISDDVWISNAVAEARQVLVTSYFDYVASLAPHLGIYSCLWLVKRIVRVRKPRATSSPSMATIVPAAARTELPAPTVALITAEREGRVAQLLTLCMSVWGVVVLGLHIDAQLSSVSSVSGVADEGCLLFQRPWLASNISCSVLRLNCYRRGITGSSEELEASLAMFNRAVLSWITFAHCPALEIPPILAQLHRVYVIDVHNSTLVEWPMESAITQAQHPNMVKVTFSNSRIPSFPKALLHNKLPRALTAIGFYHCNLSELPEKLGEVWASSAINVFALEGSSVRRLPVSFSRISWRILWLASNEIDELPETLMTNARLERLWVSGNPLARLPEVGGDTAHLAELYAEDTNLTTVPAWVDTWLKAPKPPTARTSVSFYGSPVCRDSASAYDTRLCRETMGTTEGVTPYNTSAKKYPL